MESAILFMVLGLVILIAWMGWSLRGMTWTEKYEYMKSHDGKGILKGIALAVLIPFILVIIFSISGCSPINTEYGKFNNGGSAFVGLDYTKKQSPMCEGYGPDSHTTSNLGLKYHAFETNDSKLKLNTKYTHHSCAFSPDDRQYDAYGIELEYKLW